MSKPKLVVDSQIFQTPAWDRGMGKYSLELLTALDNLNNQLKKWSSIELILSKKLHTKESVINEIKNRVPSATLSHLDLNPNYYDNLVVARRNRQMINHHIKKIQSGNSEARIDYIILSLMQSEIAPTFPSLPNVHKFLLVYDLIPLMFFQTYLSDPTTKMVYLSKLAELLRADTYLTISETVANDLASTVGISAHRILDIDGGPVSHSDTFEPFDVPKPFILMPTGNDLRKNNHRGVEGFEIFNQDQGHKYHLVITSHFEKFQIDELNRLSKNLIFTGNISGPQLNYLYREADALLFPAEYEGLGLPILEALEQNKPIICSDISVFHEISRTAFTVFNPLDPKSIGEALITSMNKRPIYDKKEYDKILNKYTWDNTAKRFIGASAKGIPKQTKKSTKQVAVFCADPSYSEAGRTGQLLYAEMQRRCELEFFIGRYDNQAPNAVDYLPYIAKTYDLAKSSDFDLDKFGSHLYFIDNNPASSMALLAALAKPGVLVLNDVILDELWGHLLNQKLIGLGRYEVEKKLDESFKVPGASFLTSLAAGQSIIATQNNKDKNNIEMLVKKIGSKAKIIKLGAPKPDVVYPGIISADVDRLKKSYRPRAAIEKYINDLLGALK
jgi:glycosyltransferase involved in cell wall biosynthesis